MAKPNTTPASSSPALTMLTLVLAMLLAYAFSHMSVWLYVAIGLATCGVFFKSLATFIHNWWFKLAHLLNNITQPILLLLLFWLVLTPVAWLFRRFGKQSPLQLSNNTNSTFRQRNTPIDKASFERMW